MNWERNVWGAPEKIMIGRDHWQSTGQLRMVGHTNCRKYEVSAKPARNITLILNVIYEFNVQLSVVFLA
jgi:hypothetical protein